ncbi:recombinase, partial [Acinetobacter baumannii]
KVVLATALTGKDYSRKITLNSQSLADVRERFGSIEPWWRDQFGYGFEGLTESEARTILTLDKGRLDADALRDRVAA